MDAVCVLYISAVTLSFVFFDLADDSGNIGLAILQCIGLINICQWGMRQSAEVENIMTSVERVIEYAKLPSEPIEADPIYHLPAGWPAHGEIIFENLNFRYSDIAEFVLKDINIHIHAKVGYSFLFV